VFDSVFLLVHAHFPKIFFFFMKQFFAFYSTHFCVLPFVLPFRFIFCLFRFLTVIHLPLHLLIFFPFSFGALLALVLALFFDLWKISHPSFSCVAGYVGYFFFCVFSFLSVFANVSTLTSPFSFFFCFFRIRRPLAPTYLLSCCYTFSRHFSSER